MSDDLNSNFASSSSFNSTKLTQNHSSEANHDGEKGIVFNSPKGLLCTGYGKINQQKHESKALQLSAKTHNLFMEHLKSFSASDVCYNLLGGRVHKCTCLRVLCDSSVQNAVAEWWFGSLKQRQLNKIKLSWTVSPMPGS